MKTARFILLAVILLTQAVMGMSLTELLRRHTEALGGTANMQRIHSYIITSTVSLGGMNGTAVSYYRAPDCYRTDVRLPLMSSSQGCKGDNCWITDNKGLTTPLGADMRGMMITEAAVRDWSYCDSAGFDGQVSLGEETRDVDSFTCYTLNISPRGGVPAVLYLDTAGFLPRQAKVQTDMGTFFSRYYDYRPVNGVMMPFRSAEMSDAGFVMGVTNVTDVQINVALSDTLFAPVSVEAAEFGLPSGVDSLLVPFDLWRNHIYVNVTVNGKGPCRFIFDSGAGGIAVNRRLAETANLIRLGTAEARGVGGADSSEIYQVDSLEIAGLRLTDLPGSAINLEPLEAGTGAQIDGIIGYDLLSRFVISVDYARHQLIIYRPDIQPRSDWGIACSLSVDLRLPYVNATVQDTIPARFRLDTGSSSTIDFQAPFARAHGLLQSASERRVTASGIGGAIEGNVGLSPRINLCGAGIDSILAHFSSTETGVFAGANTAGNIGAGVLKAFRVTFAYGRQQVYLQPNKSLVQPCNNMAGVILSSQDGQIIVKEVIYGRAADGFLLAGDRILQIDMSRTKSRSVADVDRMLTGNRGDDVRIRFERDGRVQEMDLLLDSLY